MTKDFISDMTQRYVYAATRRMPKKQRGDVAAEIKTLIEDMLEARCGDLQPTKHDLSVVFSELGRPEALATKYSTQGAPRYLIGPGLFAMYQKILVLVLSVMTGGLVLANCITLITGAASSAFSFLGGLLSSIIQGGLTAFAIITLIFAILERKEIDPVVEFDKGPLDLPPMPEKQAEIKRGEAIAGMVFTLLVMLLFTFAPGWMGAATFTQEYGFIPLFDQGALTRLLPLLLLSFGLGLVREVLKLLEGRYSRRLAAAIVILDLAAIGLCVPLFLGAGIWNPQFGSMISQAVGEPQLAHLFQYFTKFFFGVLLFAFVLDMGTAVWKAVKYE